MFLLLCLQFYLLLLPRESSSFSFFPFLLHYHRPRRFRPPVVTISWTQRQFLARLRTNDRNKGKNGRQT